MPVSQPLMLEVRDMRIAQFLVSNPQKNQSHKFMWVFLPSGAKAPWMLVDGCFDR